MVGETSKTLERQVKAGYIYTILKHVAWHGSPSPRTTKTANVCIIGDRALSVLFKVLEKRHKQRHEHDLTVNLTYSANGVNIPDCHMLFIGKAAADRLPSILEQANSRPMLTISDIKGFADKGGMIELRKVKDGARTNIKLRINAARAEEKNVALGVELLFIADHVEGEELLIITDRLH
jgi:hypothetical protein